MSVHNSRLLIAYAVVRHMRLEIQSNVAYKLVLLVKRMPLINGYTIK